MATAFDVLYAYEQIVLIVGSWPGRGSGSSRAVAHHLRPLAEGSRASTAWAPFLPEWRSTITCTTRAVFTMFRWWLPWRGSHPWGSSHVELRPTGPPASALGPNHSLWTARLAMIAVFSTPLMVAWAEFGQGAPPRVRSYRLFLTVAAMVFMGTLVFAKQHCMDRELLHLLRLSRENLEETCKLKDELESKEQSLRWHSLELQRKNLELQEISFTDPLTGVWNRRYLEEILTAEAGQVLRNYERARGSDIRKLDHRDLIFIMVDVDFFKEVNDLHGHPAGDRLLQRVAERLSRVVRKSDVLVRWGGEEFLIMSRSADPSGTPAFCERVLEIMAAETFDLGHGVRVRKTCSVGWAPFPWSRTAYDAVCAEEMIELADTALYRAKAGGRNQGVGILPGDGAAATPQAITLEALRNDNSVLTRTVRVQNPEGRAHAVAEDVISGQPRDI